MMREIIHDDHARTSPRTCKRRCTPRNVARASSIAPALDAAAQRDRSRGDRVQNVVAAGKRHS